MKKGIIIILVIAVIAAMVFFNIRKNNDTGTPVVSTRNTVAVKTATIGKESISSYIMAPGKIEETDKAQVFFDTPLRVLKVFVNKNDQINKGDRLVELDVATMTDEMNRLKLQKEIQSITLKKLTSGQNLLSLETNLTSARNARDRAQESYDSTLTEYDNQEKLFQAGIISKTQLDQYARSVKDAKASLDNAQINLDSAEKTYQSSVGSHDMDIQVQIKNIELLSLQIADVEKRLEKVKALEMAPIDGYVTGVSVIEGAYTGSGQPAFTIIDAKNIRIVATVNEYKTKDVAIGQKVTITGEAFGDNVKFSGRVVSVAPIAVISGQETVVEVVIEPLEGIDVLKPGLNVDCNIVTQEKNDIVVSEFNIYLEDKDRRQYAMVIDEDSMTVRKQYVILGIYSDMLVEVVDGLKEGDRAVINPQPSLGIGDRIRIVE